ncbi:EcsC family protein [Micromonospora sp. RL09-050-HVF-A]|uniref:EcsC family protein n=1 Tax=Micromonospora sp. RL09-050-HVF-A TaxID=1703433 RepID=UPI001C5E70BC|nr:EcsC family protein [Micromonospora sp. RL09-050-HVF-A]MBW4705020.1 EcsC family protein [Micromonospora sp. RL09-050-HVF-A]
MDADEHSEGPSNAIARHFQNLTVKVIQDGVGPITGSIPYAEARLGKALPACSIVDSDGAPLRDNASEAAIERVIDRLIKESVAAASTNGFVTGLGGFVAMPVTLPANIAGSLVINARLVGSIAYLRGYDISDPQFQTFIVLTTAGGTLAGSLQAAGVQIGAKLTAHMIRAIPIAVIRKINAQVGFMLLAKYGTQRSAITLAKGIPIAGGLVGAGMDAALTALVGRAAKANFPASI